MSRPVALFASWLVVGLRFVPRRPSARIDPAPLPGRNSRQLLTGVATRRAAVELVRPGRVRPGSVVDEWMEHAGSVGDTTGIGDLDEDEDDGAVVPGEEGPIRVGLLGVPDPVPHLGEVAHTAAVLPPGWGVRRVARLRRRAAQPRPHGRWGRVRGRGRSGRSHRGTRTRA